MTAFTSGNPAARIGKLKGDILAHAMPAKVFGITGQQRMMPKNSSKTISHRMYLPYGASNTDWNTRNRPSVDAVAHELVEGVTPTAVNGITQMFKRDVSMVVKRKYVERLARAKETGYDQTVDDRLGERMNMLHNKHSLRYPFQVNRDDNPRGAAWLRSILAGR